MNPDKKYHMVYITLRNNEDMDKLRLLLQAKAIPYDYDYKRAYGFFYLKAAMRTADLNVVSEFMAENQFYGRKVSYIDNNRIFDLFDDLLSEQAVNQTYDWMGEKNER